MPKSLTCAFCVLLLSFGFLSELGAQSPVWPGDANNNGICNQYDLLHMGVAFSDSGAARDSVDISWIGHNLNTLWGSVFFGGPDRAYADCDGNGSIELNDTIAIQQNFGLTHGTIIPDSTSIGGPVLPGISFSIPQDSAAGGSTVLINLNLGSVLNPIDSIYGVGFSVSYDTSLVTSVSMDFNGSMFHNGGGSPLTFFRDLRSESRFVASIVRTNHQNASGFGSGGTVIIVMEDNLKTKMAPGMLVLNMDELVSMNRLGQLVQMSTGSDSVYVFAARNGDLGDAGIRLYPNPANDRMRLDRLEGKIGGWEIIAIDGRMITRKDLADEVSTTDLNSAELADGIYLIRVLADGNWFSGRFIIRH